MELSKLIHKLHYKKCFWNHTADARTEIYQCRLLDQQTPLQEHILYLITPGQLKQELDVAGYSFLCIGSEADFSKIMSFQNANDIRLPEDLEPGEVEIRLSGILSRSQMLTGNMYRVIQILLDNLGMQALADAAYDVLGNPVIIADNSYKILASCLNPISGRPDLDIQKDLGYVLESNISAMKQSRLYENARKAHYPYYCKEKGASAGWITALVHIHNIETAHVAVADSNRLFTQEDYEFIDFFCRIVSLELQKSDFYKTNRSMMHSFFLSELLDNRILDLETIYRRARSLDWTITDYLRIMTITDRKSVLFDQKAQLISRQMTSLFPVCHWVIYQGHIVFLIGTSDPSTERFRTDQRLIEFLEVNHLTAAFCRAFHSLLDTRRFYEEALIAYQIGQRFHPEACVHFYTDYICQHIARILSEHSSLSNFYHPAIDRIREYDQKHSSCLLETLKEYLAHPDNPGLAADHLCIHKNTLFYRMAKLRELFGLDLSSGDERLNLQLSLKFMESETVPGKRT